VRAVVLDPTAATLLGRVVNNDLSRRDLVVVAATTPEQRWLIAGALAAVYFIWGSTYLALRYLVEEFPPFLGTAIRFAVAGVILYAWARRRGRSTPTAAEWRAAAVVGSLLLVGGVGLVAVAEQIGVGSGLAATAIAVMPVWTALWSGLFGAWPSRFEWAGLAIGLAGVVVLSGEGDFAGNSAGMVLIIVSPILWSFGSVWATHLPMPRGMMAAAVQMLGATPVLFCVGLLRGESFEGAPGVSGWLALAYLILIGSVVAYSAYIYLLQTVRPALATSYAYVNPVVAVVLGVTVGGELLSGEAYVALPLILAGVGLVALGRRS
jgi:drug/metabolite transporter (DMT)-like permease